MMWLLPWFSSRARSPGSAGPPPSLSQGRERIVVFGRHEDKGKALVADLLELGTEAIFIKSDIAEIRAELFVELSLQ